MLRIIDQRWREHLEEMDYLQEGINLRAMGQKDPLVEWQREGFEMFGAMMNGIAQDFVQLRDARPGRPEQQEQPPARRWCRTCRQTSSDDDEAGGFDRAARGRRSPRASIAAGGGAGRTGADQAADGRQGRLVEDAAQRARARAGRARSSRVPRRDLSGSAGRPIMRDFTDDLRDAAAPPRRGARAT